MNQKIGNCGPSSTLITPVIVNDTNESLEASENQNPWWLPVGRNLKPEGTLEII